MFSLIILNIVQKVNEYYYLYFGGSVRNDSGLLAERLLK